MAQRGASTQRNGPEHRTGSQTNERAILTADLRNVSCWPSTSVRCDALILPESEGDRARGVPRLPATAARRSGASSGLRCV